MAGATFEAVQKPENSMISFIRKHKIIFAVASLIVAGALWYLFRPEELFINKRVNEPAPFAANDAAQPIYTGTLSEKLHETSGRATVYRQPDGTLTLRLTDFHTSNGSDVHVVLTTANDPALQSKVPGKALSSIDIGELKGNEGDQEYKLPPNIDFARYSTVAIYCERFKAVFGTATLQPF